MNHPDETPDPITHREPEPERGRPAGDPVYSYPPAFPNSGGTPERVPGLFFGSGGVRAGWRAIEAAMNSIIDVFDDSIMTQSGIAQPRGEALVVAMGNLAIDEQPEPIGMGKCRAFARGFEFGKGLGHAGKPELGELIEHRMGQQCPFSLTG